MSLATMEASSHMATCVDYNTWQKKLKTLRCTILNPEGRKHHLSKTPDISKTSYANYHLPHGRPPTTGYEKSFTGPNPHLSTSFSCLAH